VEISAKADYAIRALAELAAADGGPLTVTEIAEAQQIPARFLQNILLQLRRRSLVRSQRGAEGGYRLARPAAAITLADAIRAVDGPLAAVRGEPPNEVTYEGRSAILSDVWIGVRVALRRVLEQVTVEDVAHGPLPAAVTERAENPKAWASLWQQPPRNAH
jgi:Rrf2 family protein